MQAYPVIITKDEEWYVVYVPDLGISTQGESMPNAIEMARDAICLYCCFLEDRGDKLPPASAPSDLQAEEGATVVSVAFDLAAYRKENDS